jgi:hypothetical protein
MKESDLKKRLLAANVKVRNNPPCVMCMASIAGVLYLRSVVPFVGSKTEPIAPVWGAVQSMMLKHQIDKVKPQMQQAAVVVGELPTGAARKLLGRGGRGAPATPVVSLPAGSPLNVPSGMVAQGTPNGVILRQETMQEKKARERLTKAQMNKIQAAERNWEKFKTHLIATEQQAERLYEAAQQAKAEAGMLEGTPAPAETGGASQGMMADAGMTAAGK